MHEPVSGAAKSHGTRMAGAPSYGPPVGFTDRQDGKECAGWRKPLEDLTGFHDDSHVQVTDFDFKR
eukprot:2698713-Rhodomonas_salina.5